MSHSIRYATPPSSEITPQAVYLNRRAFLRAAAVWSRRRTGRVQPKADGGRRTGDHAGRRFCDGRAR